MKRVTVFVLLVVCVLGFVGCSNKNMSYIIENKPSIVGIVEEVHDDFIIIYIETDGYPNGASCKVSLDMENTDGFPEVSVGDEVIVYYNGDIAESDPLQINTVYAIKLRNSEN